MVLSRTEPRTASTTNDPEKHAFSAHSYRRTYARTAARGRESILDRILGQRKISTSEADDCGEDAAKMLAI